MHIDRDILERAILETCADLDAKPSDDAAGCIVGTCNGYRLTLVVERLDVDPENANGFEVYDAIANAATLEGKP